MERADANARRLRARAARAALATVVLAAVLAPAVAHAIPAFSRKYEMSCRTCHDYHAPQLNAFGRLYLENGYQLPAGAEDAVRARRSVEPGPAGEVLALAKEPPLGFRGQIFGAVPLWGTNADRPAYDNKLFTYLYGGGSLAPDLSFFFSFTPYPQLVLHHLKIGVHNVAESWLGEGSLNLRAGSFLLLEGARPGHRLLDAGINAFGEATVGLNQLSLDLPALGVAAFGHPDRGPFGYHVAIVAGDPGPSGTERDGWKDVFLRLSWTFFHDSSHELTLGAFGYRGRSDIRTKLGGVDLLLTDDVWYLGGDLESALGPLTIFVAGYAARHRDARPELGAVAFTALRGELSWAITDDLSITARQERVRSAELASMSTSPLSVHLAYLLAANVVASVTWRHDFDVATKRAIIALVDVAF
ncbi:hypothetical protein L6R52_28870 [Myxococcota bacterium]|nr:hypothetical protein [Myxococcota bacterium]